MKEEDEERRRGEEEEGEEEKEKREVYKIGLRHLAHVFSSKCKQYSDSTQIDRVHGATATELFSLGLGR